MVTFDRKNYERILRQIASLIEKETDRNTLKESGRNTLNGCANADWWDNFESHKDIYESLEHVIIGIMKALDIIQIKIDDLNSRLKKFEER
jgi:hypothetical protein